MEELEQYHAFKVPKRKLEWLFSRWTGKKLAAGVLGETDLRLIRVQKEAGGVPFVVATGRRTGWLSLSHSHRGVLAAFATDGTLRFGVDLEHLEPRSTDLINDFFTTAERAWVAGLPGNDQTLAANLVWSAKEAYLKAIGLGLQIDTRNVEIRDCELVENNDWQPVGFCVNNVVDPAWRLYYRREEEYILTMCLPPDAVFHRLKTRETTVLREEQV